MAKVIWVAFIRLCQDILMPGHSLYPRGNVSHFWFWQDCRQTAKTEWRQQEGRLRRMSWTGPAGAETVMAEELQKWSGDRLRK